MICITITYKANEDIMHKWGLLVAFIERIYGYSAIPRYATKCLGDGINSKDVLTNAPIEIVEDVIDKLFILKNCGEFKELVDITKKYTE